ncbi:FAD-dependent oxidoreductase [Niastella koreensis]|uniref:Pyridine nucleotide-disulfide oxidoreductase domain-containing protein 2 n=2 Tax=Niastella koreensis TaxID=354356 RepID=G8TC93_NIAKG|nr:NAD(P)/FAD-dependent oxidoreductase [Niastella koreensis]AEW00400.1 HI0933 family protein [Niastella koreensis GR20-10]OQP52267.1 FAD-dependent oxidoreductase [Niastella koreensis]
MNVMNTHDAIVVGSGPNGLAAAITLQQAGVKVLLLEGKKTIGGGLRTAELTLPGYLHDICSAIHPMAVASPFMSQLPLHEYGLEFIEPEVEAAHPFDDGTAAVLKRSISATARLLGKDEQAYVKFIQPITEMWPDIAPDILGPFHFPKHPLAMAKFGLKGLTSANYLSREFQTAKAKGLWAGMAAHSIQPLTGATTSAIGLVLMAAGHLKGWPVPKGGSASIANALAAYFVSLGGTIETNSYVRSIDQLPAAKAVLFDVTPKQLLAIAGNRFNATYTKQLQRYRYGMGVFKIDWALQEPIPFTASECRQAGTVHIGNTIEEIVESERLSSAGVHPEKPFVLLAQPSVFDATRAPAGKHTAWAYCHVPHGSTVDMTSAIENQVERFAPGFKDLVLARHTFNTQQLEAYNPNYIGGDINGGVIDLRQLYTRPAMRWSPYTTPAKGIYICSSSTPPGGGVHGMCGYHAARKALQDIFAIDLKID